MSAPKPYTHEQYIHAVRDIVARNLSEPERAALYAVKLVYGAGESGLRGVTYYDKWTCTHNGKGQAFAEICAFGEESPVQVAGTTIHELGHVLAGHGAGHGPKWREACEHLGLRFVRAAGTRYSLACFKPDVRMAVIALPKPADGKPQSAGGSRYGVPLQMRTLKPCGAGYGARGGKSRGIGSGSRHRKFVCACAVPVIVRSARDDLRALCLECNTQFRRADIPAKAAA